MDFISYQGNLPDSGNQTAYKIAAQPSLPYPIAKDTNFFLRKSEPAAELLEVIQARARRDQATGALSRPAELDLYRQMREGGAMKARIRACLFDDADTRDGARIRPAAKNHKIQLVIEK